MLVPLDPKLSCLLLYGETVSTVHWYRPASHMRRFTSHNIHKSFE
jgi:hypothetical protein